MKKMEIPEVNVIKFEEVDVIQTSNNNTEEHAGVQGITYYGSAYGVGDDSTW